MGYYQKINWIALITGIAVFAWYGVQIMSGVGEGALADVAWKGPMITSLIAYVVLLIAMTIVLAVLDRKELASDDIIEDERDHDIERRSDVWAGYVLHGFVFLALALLVLDQPAFWVANALYVGSIVSGAVSVTLRIRLYRMGM